MLFWLISFVTVLASSVWAAPVPLLRIEEPTDGQIIESYVVNLKFSLKNFTLKDYRAALKNNPSQGHLLLWLDKDERKTETAVKYFKESPYPLADVSPGKHTLVVELVNNDSTRFDPKISQTIKFETKAPPGSEATPLKPADLPPVGETTTGEAPRDSSPARAFLSGGKYFLAAGAFFLLGLFGLFMLRRSDRPNSL